MHKAFKVCTAVLLALVMTVSLVSGALAVVVRNDDDTISYEPLEQGVYSKGGYTIDKVSHPTLGAGEVDGILTGDLQDRGQSYSWSMAEAGDYVYIGTCYNSTYYIYHNNVKTSLDAMKKEGKLDQNVDTSRAAADFVKVMFGTDTFDETPMSQWTPVIMAVNRYTGEAQVIFRERDILKDYPDIFPGYPPYLKGVNYLAGYRMAFEFKGKIYFAGMGSPTATLIEVDPETNECSIAYHNINYTQGVSNGVHGLLVFDDEIYMCLATDNYDGKGTPGGIIVASSDPTAGLSSWRRVADQDDFDGLPAVMKTDGLNGGGIWDIIEYNGSMYVTVVTDKSIDGHINKQGFAMYRGDKHEDGSFTWTQVIGDHGTSGYGFGLGINYSMSCNITAICTWAPTTIPCWTWRRSPPPATSSCCTTIWTTPSICTAWTPTATSSRWPVRTTTPISPTAPSATWARVWATTPTSISGATASTTVSCTSAPMTPPL